MKQQRSRAAGRRKKVAVEDLPDDSIIDDATTSGAFLSLLTIAWMGCPTSSLEVAGSVCGEISTRTNCWSAVSLSTLQEAAPSDLCLCWTFACFSYPTDAWLHRTTMCSDSRMQPVTRAGSVTKLHTSLMGSIRLMLPREQGVSHLLAPWRRSPCMPSVLCSVLTALVGISSRWV